MDSLPAPPDSLFTAEDARRALARARNHAERVRADCMSLHGFIRAAWHVVEPGTTFVDGWHIAALCMHLEAVTRGEINRLLINVPPGSSKSLIVSVLWPAWEWGPAGKPHLKYLTTSFNEQPIKRDTRKTRDLILSDWYQALWPDVKLTRKGETSFANTATGNREGVPFGSLTSQRGNRLIVDDPHSVKTAESDADRARTVLNFAEGSRNRINDQVRDAIIVIMQRLHDQDISGWILKNDPAYVHLCLPMEFVPKTRCVTRIGFSDPRTKEGEILDPVRFPPAAIADLKIGGSYQWSGQYQQDPAPRKGGFFLVDLIGRAKSMPINTTRRVRAWDLAATDEKPGIDPDYTAGVLMARSRDDGKFYIGNVRRDRLSSGKVRSLILATAQADRIAGETTILIPQDPGQAGKGQAADYGRALAGYPVRIEPVGKGNKTMRADPFASQVELGNVVIVETGDAAKDAWIDPFIDELRRFPVGHDDQVDAAGDAFKPLAVQNAQGWLDFMAEQVEAKKKAGRAT